MLNKSPKSGIALASVLIKVKVVAFYIFYTGGALSVTMGLILCISFQGDISQSWNRMTRMVRVSNPCLIIVQMIIVMSVY